MKSNKESKRLGPTSRKISSILRLSLVSKDRNGKKEEGKPFRSRGVVRGMRRKSKFKIAARVGNFERVRFYLKQRRVLYIIKV